MFERGPAFDTKAGFRGAVLAGYSRDRNPLESGYVLHPERIQGKAAALEVFFGDGRVYLIGFRPQWRGQSHGTYKFFFNAIYDSPASAKPSAPARAAGSASAPDAVRTIAARVRTDLGAMLLQNRSFFAARGQAAVEERAKLNAVVDAFEKDRIQEVQDMMGGLDEAGRKKASDAPCAARRRTCEPRKRKRAWMRMGSRRNTVSSK